jgi:hypothetical protein
MNESFDRVYDEIDALENHMNQRFDRVEQEIAALNGKTDSILRHITGLNS